jgi:hypothetical protein
MSRNLWSGVKLFLRLRHRIRNPARDIKSLCHAVSQYLIMYYQQVIWFIRLERPDWADFGSQLCQWCPALRRLGAMAISLPGREGSLRVARQCRPLSGKVGSVAPFAP